MPTVRDKIEVNLEFQVQCGICGFTTCLNSEYKDENTDVFNMTCPFCEKNIKALEERIDDLEAEISELSNQQSN
jgi:uncharacterized ferredoxin-like protein